MEPPEIILDLSPELHDDKTVFQFSSRSNGKKKAGKGTGEKISDDELNSYSELNGIDDWRRKLDNDWSQEFVVDDKRWASVTHYLYGIVFNFTI